MKQDDPIVKVLSKLDDLTIEVRALRADAKITKTDVKMIYLRQDSTETNIKAMQIDIADMKSDVRRLEVLHEDMNSSIENICEVMAPVMEQTASLKKVAEDHSDNFKSHERRISFLEKKIA
jgi:chromosome segregation ATPase